MRGKNFKVPGCRAGDGGWRRRDGRGRRV